MYAPATITLKPGKDCVYDFDSITGGGETRNFEIYAGGNITFNTPIDYVCGYIYPRNKSVGVWINSEEPCFVNCLNEISVRNNDGFVGGNGILDCSILCKVGNTTHICPGYGLFFIGFFTVIRTVSLII